jgi:hypothetical protein
VDFSAQDGLLNDAKGLIYLPKELTSLVSIQKAMEAIQGSE